MSDVRTALPGDLPAAVEVWHAANTARGLPPTASRLARIREKLTASDATVLVATLPVASAVAAPAAVALAAAAPVTVASTAVAPGVDDPAVVASAVAPAAVASVDLASVDLAAVSDGPGREVVGPEVVVGMALVEQGRADDGAGEPVPGYGHVSMVFVHPSHWSNGYGQQLLRAVAALGWTRTTLWTRQSNSRAQRLYAAAGYTPTGRVAHLHDGDAIIQLEHLTGTRPA
ncbi:GNAT family N-acetyltransferase [Dactylosporangium cerinum]|uniref:GNAT family N-acetyltransferase n=1 Tax=Dactylosporangium cerinum TaxID=1434730 RepID=A0ABV9VPX4_9ACTN